MTTPLLPQAINVLKEQIFQRKLPSVELSTFLQTQNAAPAGLGSQQPDWLSEEDARAAYEAMKQAEALTFQKPEKQRLMRRRRVLLIDDVSASRRCLYRQSHSITIFCTSLIADPPAVTAVAMCPSRCFALHHLLLL